ncbi:MAG: HNH endonuclease [Anaerolineae bacterium]|nr:HNH endonuclease [Anaerolineae bacterium]
MIDDLAIRLAAFKWLSQQTDIHGDVLPRSLLQSGFKFGEDQIPLVSPQGIFKPKMMELPLTITTTTNGPYQEKDSFGPDNLLIYSYRGTDPLHRDNVGLRKLRDANRPLIFFHGIVPGRYLAVWPVYIVDDDPARLFFKVALDEMAKVNVDSLKVTAVGEAANARRAYLTSTVKVRLHQRQFRERVLRAYQSQCAICRLRHQELLDAAHIIPDEDEAGEPVVSNGLALCKLHHAAYDKFIIGVTPDHIVEVREDVLYEIDGPLLEHGLKGIHQSKIILPKSRSNWPNRDSLDWRYQRFRKAG